MLLASQVLLWASEDSDNKHLVNAASAWEIATKGKLNKFRNPGLWEVPHRDPPDYMLAAQAKAGNLLLASMDSAFAQFEGVVVLG
jgi:PIN domain nuclease of toxin-antitoxin system